MRIHIRNRVLELLTTVYDGVKYISNADNYNAELINEDCLWAFDSIRETLEDSLSEKRFTYYNDLINKIVKLLNTLMFKKNSGEQLEIENVLKHIFIFKQSLQEEKEVKIKVLFLPYKASMWDSLESIWLAVEEDTRCESYVVPIPYYDRDSQGRFSVFHYEGDLFPNNVPITHYTNYDIAVERPDVIYFHNPYDGNNYLTSVAPEYYSDKLKKYTDMLIYVPYFVAGSTDTAVVNLLPAYINSSKMIVQSKITRDIYIASGLKENKILTVGSPKIDAILKSEKEHKDIPLLWREKTIGKKVILFNTGIADLLSVNAWLDQIEFIVDYFIDHPEFALIWRPHPLTRITLNTMRPQVLNAYSIIIERVKKVDNIIIDNTSDIYLATSVSDGLISDYSSVMLQYIITGKPVLGILEEKMLKKDRYFLADYLGCYFVNSVTIPQFVEHIVSNNDDYFREERINRFIQSISNADGTCGYEIHSNIIKEVIRKI